jgi:PAS domain S-box-containing protein
MGLSGQSRYHWRKYSAPELNLVIQRPPFRQLFLIMAAATLLVSALSIASLYSTAIEQHQLRLVETVQSQARLIEAIASFEIQSGNRDQGKESQASTLQQVADAHRNFTGFGESGEFALARHEEDQIIFVLSRRHIKSETPHPIPFNGKWAEPMRLALSGKSGFMTGLDYRGVEVLAAHEPVSILNLGLVAKMDISEIRAPFLRAGLIAVAVAMLVIFLASRLFFRISRPIEEGIDRQEETFRTLAETSLEGIILASTRGEIQYLNSAAERLFGYKKGELLGQPLTCLMPREHSRAHDGYVKNYLQTGIAKIIGTGRQLTALRKDGTRFPIHLSIGDIHLSHTRLFAGVIMDLSEQRQLQREILEIPVNEQRRIGQELHDGLGQQLTGLGMLAASLVNKAGKPEHELASKLARGLQQAISQVRALSRGLMPVEIDAVGFMSAIEILIADIRAQINIPIELKLNHQIKISDNSIALHLYRIVQEAINNAIKHAAASEIRVTLGIEENRGRITIHDNGRGMLHDKKNDKGLGLRIMKHRCGLIDAELHINPSPDGGTEVKCFFPIDQGQSE